jgi:anti-sigma B factor antagonist
VASYENELSITTVSTDARAVFRLAGEIDAANADTVPLTVLSTDIADASLVVIDLTDVAFIDSSGLRALLTCRAGLSRRGLAVEVRNPSHTVRRLFEITHLTELLA